MAVINVADFIYYISGLTNVGIIEEQISQNESVLYMIDSGGTSEDGKKILNEITEYFNKKNEKIFNISIDVTKHAKSE